jgi:hypothetical protein
VSAYSPELAMAHVVMRLGGLRSLDDIQRLRERIEGEREHARRFVESREKTLVALNAIMPPAGDET